MRATTVPVAVLVSVCCVLGCAPQADNDATTGTTNPTSPTTEAPGGDTLDSTEWAPCAPLTADMAADPECKTYRVPLRWDHQGSDPTIAFTVYRYLSDAAEPMGQVWGLDGGPGGTGAGPGNASFVDSMTAQGFDVYIPSQRGTAGEDEITCGNPRDVASCHADLVAEWSLEGLAGFATAEAALDTQLALADTDDGGPQYLYGTSYGTYLAMRLLQIDGAVDGAVLDSSMTFAPDIWNAGRYTDEVVLDLFDVCAEDPECVARFPIPIDEALARVNDATHCPEVAPSAMARGEMIGFMTRMAAVAPLAFTSRLARCDQEDIDVFQELEQLLSYQPQYAQGWPSQQGAINQVVYLTVVAHDFVSPMTQVDYDVMQADVASLTFANAGAGEYFWSIKSQFPVVDGFTVDQAVPDDLPPVLVLQGGTDLQTPPAWGQRAADSTGGTLVTIPEAGHGVYRGENACAQRVTDAFLADPAAQPDLACVDALGPPDLGEPEGAAGFLQYAFGISTMWPALP